MPLWARRRIKGVGFSGLGFDFAWWANGNKLCLCLSIVSIRRGPAILYSIFFVINRRLHYESLTSTLLE